MKMMGVLLAFLLLMSLGVAAEQVEKKAEDPAGEWFRQQYMMWRLWHGELVEGLGDNSLRDKGDCKRIIESLERMRKGLDEEGQKIVDKALSVYKDVYGMLSEGRLQGHFVRAKIEYKLRKAKRVLKQLDAKYVKSEYAKKAIEAQKAGEAFALFKETKDEEDFGPTTKAKARYVADINGKYFHRFTCPRISNIKPKDRIYFRTQAAAKKAGYKPCPECIGGAGW